MYKSVIKEKNRNFFFKSTHFFINFFKYIIYLIFKIHSEKELKNILKLYKNKILAQLHPNY